MLPFTKFFEYESNSEKIFFSGLSITKNRLSQNLRINLNETLMLYAGLITNELRAGKSSSEIKEIVGSFLSPDKVMIGVPESLKHISFDVKIDENPKQIIKLEEPIPTSDYILTPK
jgi:urease gamma subunit